MNLDQLEKLVNEVQWREVPERAVEIYTKYADTFASEWEKQGTSTLLNTLAQYMNLIPGEFPGGLPNHPSPLTSMLVGGLAGAGLGYGAGYLGEHLLPQTWQRGKLRRTLATAGGALGAAPGAAWGLVNKADGRSFNDSELFQQPRPPVDVSNNMDQYFTTLDHIPDYLKEDVKVSFEKAAKLYPGTGLVGPPIDVTQFNQTIWQDPRVAGMLPVPLRAAASGLVTGAANLPGKDDTQFVTPFDVARMAAGMGSGYLSGMLVGKALGILTGMPQETQDKLKTTGMWAGVIANLVPIAFGA